MGAPGWSHRARHPRPGRRRARQLRQALSAHDAHLSERQLAARGCDPGSVRRPRHRRPAHLLPTENRTCSAGHTQQALTTPPLSPRRCPRSSQAPRPSGTGAKARAQRQTELDQPTTPAAASSDHRHRRRRRPTTTPPITYRHGTRARRAASSASPIRSPCGRDGTSCATANPASTAERDILELRRPPRAGQRDQRLPVHRQRQPQRVRPRRTARPASPSTQRTRPDHSHVSVTDGFGQISTSDYDFHFARSPGHRRQRQLDRLELRRLQPASTAVGPFNGTGLHDDPVRLPPEQSVPYAPARRRVRSAPPIRSRPCCSPVASARVRPRDATVFSEAASPPSR